MPACHSILVVDDNNDVRETIVQALLFEGYRVRGASNGREALEALAGLPGPSLILLDLMMPEMNGWEFIASLHALTERSGVNPRHAIVTMSAVDFRYSPQDAPAIAVDGSLPKPISLPSLFDKIEEFCVAPVPAASAVVRL